MKFYHQGKRKTNEPGMLSGCLMIIGFGAILFLFTLFDDINDVKDYLFEVILALAAGIGLLVALYSKKGKLSNHHITIKNRYFSMGKVNIPLERIILDVYQKDNIFIRYHLRDSDGKIAVYSVLKDDLLTYFQKNLTDQVFKIEESNSVHDGPYISVSSNQRSLKYNLNSGKYTIKEDDTGTISFLPDVYTYDGKYKKVRRLLRNGKLSKK